MLIVSYCDCSNDCSVCCKVLQHAFWRENINLLKKSKTYLFYLFKYLKFNVKTASGCVWKALRKFFYKYRHK